MIIKAPISVGELYDKITILEVKLERLDDASKLANVERELRELKNIAKAEVETSPNLNLAGLLENVEKLKAVNSELWDIENGKRAAEETKSFDAAFIDLARQVYMKNDWRAAIKRRINSLSGSTIVEEKSHKAASV